MLNITETLKILNSFNINSHKYGPTIYQENDNIGICLDIKDSNFGFLTRSFTFQDSNSLEDFLKKYNWYKDNHEKYNVNLSLTEYDTKTPKIKYTRDNLELTLNDMLNIDNIITENKEQIINSDNKNAYLININKITEYLIKIKKQKDTIKTEKNNLKIQENELKYQLLIALSKYYGRNNIPMKNAVSLENIIPNNDAILLQNNAKNISNKSVLEVKNYLTTLINITKEEELDEKHIINVYSNLVYKFNIEILNKQIEFVKNKINSEKNFSLRGSKNHNIDEELKSFLKTSKAPIKIELFIQESKQKILEKYNKITDVINAYTVISGENIIIPKTEIPKYINKKSILENLTSCFDALTKEVKVSLILYNSLYKNLCNYIINNNYPNIEDIKSHFDFEYYYKEIEEIVYNENNSHYLINYFNILNFKNLDSYITSLTEMCKNIENIKFNTIGPLKAFNIKETNKYKTFTINPIYNTPKDIYFIDIPTNTSVIYIPEKLEIDTDTKEIVTIATNNILIATNINSTNNTLTVNKYNKITEKYNNSDIIITTDLTLNKSTIFQIGTIEGAI